MTGRELWDRYSYEMAQAEPTVMVEDWDDELTDEEQMAWDRLAEWVSATGHVFNLVSRPDAERFSTQAIVTDPDPPVARTHLGNLVRVKDPEGEPFDAHVVGYLVEAVE